MDKDKQIQKIPKLSLEKLGEDSKLVKRGLRDLNIWPKIQTLLKKIEERYFADSYQECIDLCDEVLASEPLHFPHLYYRAYSLIRLEKYEEARIWIDRAIEVEPDFKIALSNKGFCLLQLKKYDEAIVWFDRALKIAPESYITLDKKYKDFKILKGTETNILQNKAFCLEKLGRIDEAIDNYEKSLVLRPIDDKHYDFKDYIDKYFSLITYERAGVSDILKRVNKFYEIDDFEVCLAILDELLDREKNNIEAEIWKARVFQKQERYIEAIQLFTQCLSVEEKYAFVWQFRGDCYWKLNDYKKSLSDYLRAIELDSSNGVVYDNAAMCFFNTGEYDKAHEFIDKAITLEEAEMPMIRKAQFFEFQEKTAEALEQYKKTLEKFPFSEYAKKKILELSNQ